MFLIWGQELFYILNSILFKNIYVDILFEIFTIIDNIWNINRKYYLPKFIIVLSIYYILCIMDV